MSREISAKEAKKLIHDGAEIAFLDVREAGEFGEGHPLFAIPCPYSTLEARIAALVPRRGVRLLLIDGGDGVAVRGAAALEGLGYRDVMIVDGGTPAWAASGFTLFQGVNVPSKTPSTSCSSCTTATTATWRPRAAISPGSRGLSPSSTRRNGRRSGSASAEFRTRSPQWRARPRVACGASARRR